MRIFCAIELADEARERIAAQIAILRDTLPAARAARWEATEKLHLTMKFLGEVAESRLDDLSSALSGAARDVETFEAVLAGAGAFPPRGATRVLWLGMGDEAGELQRLQRRLEEECATSGFPLESREFHPHITLARTGRMNASDARQLARAHLALEFTPVTFDVHELVLMQSELTPRGSRYTVLSRHTLNDERGMMNDE
jgi:2'-5' RNA ligase